MGRSSIAGQPEGGHGDRGALARRVSAYLGSGDVALEPVADAQRPGIYRARPYGAGAAPAAFVKTRARAGDDMTVEARMLADLDAAGLTVPRVLAAAPDLLVAEWVEHDRGPLRPVHERAAARALAALHDRPADGFGYAYDTPIGGAMQPNAPGRSWIGFYRDRRLLHFAKAARDRGLLPDDLHRRIETLAARLERHIAEPARPSLIHGDVWYGNVLTHRAELVAFVDPAIHHANAEFELAYVLMHGTFGRAFFDAYRELRPIAPGFLAERAPVHLIAPLLVHVLLGGPVYAHSLDRMLRRIGY